MQWSSPAAARPYANVGSWASRDVFFASTTAAGFSGELQRGVGELVAAAFFAGLFAHGAVRAPVEVDVELLTDLRRIVDVPTREAQVAVYEDPACVRFGVRRS